MTAKRITPDDLPAGLAGNRGQVIVDDLITIIAPTGRPAKIMQELLAQHAATTLHSTLELHDRIVDMSVGMEDHERRWIDFLDSDFSKVELRALSQLVSPDLTADQLKALVESPYHEEAMRLRSEYVLIDEEQMVDLPPYLREKPHHGQPRSLKETRRSQRKGGKRR